MTDGPGMSGTASRWRRVAPVLALLALAPWAAECSWGGFPATQFPLVIAVLGPLYGGAAVLIREVARRTGGGWPAMIALAAAFGVVQAGLVDQGLFNPHFLDDTEYADQASAARATMVPGVDFSAQQALTYVSNHVALSICAPIAIVESAVSPQRRHLPWLRWPGLVVIGIVYVLGSLLIFSDDSGRKGFVAGPLQVTVAAVTALALVAVALLPRWRRHRPPAAGRVPRPAWVALVVIGARFTGDVVANWWGVALGVVATVAAGWVIVRWSRRDGWRQAHVLAAWSACLVLAAAFAYFVPTYEPVTPTQALVGDVAVSVLVLALVGGAGWRLRRSARWRPRRSGDAGAEREGARG